MNEKTINKICVIVNAVLYEENIINRKTSWVSNHTSRNGKCVTNQVQCS